MAGEERPDLVEDIGGAFHLEHRQNVVDLEFTRGATPVDQFDQLTFGNASKEVQTRSFRLIVDAGGHECRGHLGELRRVLCEPR